MYTEDQNTKEFQTIQKDKDKGANTIFWDENSLLVHQILFPWR